MTKTLFLLPLLSAVAFSGQAQIISKFTWDDPTLAVTKAAVGPDATSVTSGVAITTGGAGGTDGLNPESKDISMMMAASTFELPGLDISVDFLKKENNASFFTLGNFDFGIATGSIYIKYNVTVGGVSTPFTENTQYTVSDMTNFHTYRFVYDNVAGMGTLYVDGTAVHTYPTTPGSPLNWSGAGASAIIASGMDGSGTNVAEMDNFIAQVPAVVLPLELLSFDASADGKANLLSWTTTRETGVKGFSIQRSSDGINFDEIGSVAAQQGYSATNAYSFTDDVPAAVNFYRLRMINTDGSYSYSPVKKLGGAAAAVSISCYPNPVINSVTIKTAAAGYHYTLYTVDGKLMQSGVIDGEQASINVSAAPKGLFIVRVENAKSSSSETFKLFKQ